MTKVSLCCDLYRFIILFITRWFSDKHIIISVAVVVGYQRFENKYSLGSYIAFYPSLAEAKSACNADDECGSITDSQWIRNGTKMHDWRTLKGIELKPSIKGRSSWVKLNFSKF